MEEINFLIVFIEGVLSIFSPCILPILPVYLSMLSNSSIDDIKENNFKTGTLMKNTIFFTLGISTTFFILGSSIGALSSFFTKYRNTIMIIGGFIIIFMGLFYLGIIKSQLLSREKRFNVNSKTMSAGTAFLLGLTFSFGWTPCIGPILASVLIMASTAENIITSNLLILVYTVGFILPFILASLFYSKLFKKFDKVKKYMDIIKKVSGVFIIIAGSVMLVNAFTNINRGTGSNIQNQSQVQEQSKSETEGEKKDEQANNKEEQADKDNVSSSKESENQEKKRVPIIDFELYDQDGKKHKLSDYKGKTVFLNFWATWCPPCRAEMPHINELYKEYNSNKDDVVILGVASPNLGREGSEDLIKKVLDKEGHTFPVALDEGGEVVYKYGINSFPATFIIDKEGYITKYIPGAMNKDTMKSLIESER